MIDRERADAGHEFLGGPLVGAEGCAEQPEWADPSESDHGTLDCLGASDDNDSEVDSSSSTTRSTSSSSSESSGDSEQMRGTGHRCPGGS